MVREFVLASREIELGRREPFLHTGPRGRRHIMIGEWGPLDPTKPGVHPTEGGPTFRVLGADAYEVTVPDGFGVEKDGSLFRVPRARGLHEFAGEVRIGEKRFRSRAAFSTRGGRSSTGREKTRARRARGPRLAKTELPAVVGHRLVRCGGGAEDVGRTTSPRAERRSRSKGFYEITTTSDDGVRVVDGKVVRED
jgi:hypothetical protein